VIGYGVEIGSLTVRAELACPEQRRRVEGRIAIDETMRTENVPNIKQNRAESILSRREMLRYLGMAAAGALEWGCGRSQAAIHAQAAELTAGKIPACVVRPQQTEGPFFIDEKLNRSDIRSDPTDGSVKQGVPLRLSFQVSRTDRGSCTPLGGAQVDVWQCDALGVYSDVRDRSGDSTGKKFLRGYQVTRGDGTAEFITIYPGWYPGRTVHIHFKIRSDTGLNRSAEFTSQIYFDESVTDVVHKVAPYSTKGRRTTTNDTDLLFRRRGNQLMLALTKDREGYAGKFDIALQMT
jgi:protocatechuate 3,4-dioxygenase beta subunit